MWSGRAPHLENSAHNHPLSGNAGVQPIQTDPSRKRFFSPALPEQTETGVGFSTLHVVLDAKWRCLVSYISVTEIILIAAERALSDEFSFVEIRTDLLPDLAKIPINPFEKLSKRTFPL